MEKKLCKIFLSWRFLCLWQMQGSPSVWKSRLHCSSGLKKQMRKWKICLSSNYMLSPFEYCLSFLFMSRSVFFPWYTALCPHFLFCVLPCIHPFYFLLLCFIPLFPSNYSLCCFISFVVSFLSSFICVHPSFIMSSLYQQSFPYLCPSFLGCHLTPLSPCFLYSVLSFYSLLPCLLPSFILTFFTSLCPPSFVVSF